MPSNAPPPSPPPYGAGPVAHDCRISAFHFSINHGLSLDHVVPLKPLIPHTPHGRTAYEEQERVIVGIASNDMDTGDAAVGQGRQVAVVPVPQAGTMLMAASHLTISVSL